MKQVQFYSMLHERHNISQRKVSRNTHSKTTFCIKINVTVKTNKITMIMVSERHRQTDRRHTVT